MKQSTHVLNCNGREIFVGDRVRIIGEEVSKFLRDSYGDALHENILSDTKDEFGTVVDWCHSNYLPQRDAYTIESICHKSFKAQRIRGEFFNISFEAACAELDKHTAVAERHTA